MIFQGGDDWRRTALMIAKVTAEVVSNEPERLPGIMEATTLGELADAVGIPGDLRFIDTLPYLREKYKK